MKIRLPILLVAFLCFLGRVAAQGEEQEKTPKKFDYFNTVCSGGLFGKKDKGTSFSFTTTHGLRFGNFRIALGTGFDSYQRWKVLPVFAQLSHDVVKVKNNRFFVSASGGYSWASYQVQTDFDGEYLGEKGRVFFPSVGYRISAGKWDILLNAGYKWQRLRYTHKGNWWWGFDRYSEVEEKMERLFLQIGFGLP